MSHTPGPWAVHPSFPDHVIPARDLSKKIGASSDPEVEARNYAKVIAYERGTEFPLFYRSRVLPDEARANARLIACAPDLLSELKLLEEAIMRYGIKRDGGDEEWSQAFSNLIDRIKSARDLINKAEGIGR